MATKRKKKKGKDAVAIPDTAIKLAGKKVRHEIVEKKFFLGGCGSSPSQISKGQKKPA